MSGEEQMLEEVGASRTLSWAVQGKPVSVFLLLIYYSWKGLISEVYGRGIGQERVYYVQGATVQEPPATDEVLPFALTYGNGEGGGDAKWSMRGGKYERSVRDTCAAHGDRAVVRVLHKTAGVFVAFDLIRQHATAN